ncbi:peptidase M16 [Bacteroidales bacterium]|nr:peptidase M16 [Bacteroidales bacterium]
MKLDRTIQPLKKDIKKIEIPQMNLQVLPNGIPLHVLSMGEQDVCRLDIMIAAGKWEQSKKLVASFTNLLIKEGAGNMGPKELAEKLDFYGAWLQVSQTYHHAYLTLYAPTRYFYELLALLELIVKQASFPEAELHTHLERKLQQFLVDQEKVQSLALKKFSQALFGKKHPYSNDLEKKDFSNLKRNDLLSFYSEHYHSKNTRIFVSGKINDTMIQAIEKSFGTDTWGSVQENKHSDFLIQASPKKILWVEKPDAMQNAIRMGLPVIDRMQPDFNKFRIMNTILGGYFGSRLMSNIREDKGYTYGISSSITSLKHASYLSIASQTACEFSQPLIDEVHIEISRLQNEFITIEELDMVRNYMLGDFVRNLDGIFSLSDLYISMYANDLPETYFSKQVEDIQSVSKEDIMEMAQKHLKKEEIYIIIAGTKK